MAKQRDEIQAPVELLHVHKNGNPALYTTTFWETKSLEVQGVKLTKNSDGSVSINLDKVKPDDIKKFAKLINLYIENPRFSYTNEDFKKIGVSMEDAKKFNEIFEAMISLSGDNLIKVEGKGVNSLPFEKMWIQSRYWRAMGDQGVEGVRIRPSPQGFTIDFAESSEENRKIRPVSETDIKAYKSILDYLKADRRNNSIYGLLEDPSARKTRDKIGVSEEQVRKFKNIISAMAKFETTKQPYLIGADEINTDKKGFLREEVYKSSFHVISDMWTYAHSLGHKSVSGKEPSEPLIRMEKPF